MAVKKGYKQTEVGIIPEDWSLEFVGNIADVKTGGKNTQDRVDEGQYPFFVRSQTVERINSYSFDGEAVLTAGDGVGTGKVFHYINAKFDVHQRVYRISNFNENLNGYFFYLYFSNHFYNRIMQMTAKSSVDSVRMEMITKMLIPLPPTLTEQTAIATALSDADALIEALEQLITKKRQIKHGAMQELLTGKKRLPGFSGEWEVRRLGELLDYEQPTKYLVSNSEYGDGNDVPVLTAGKTFILGYTDEQDGIFNDLPVIIFDDFTTASKYVTFPFKAKSSAMKMLKPKDKKTSLRLIFELIQSIKFQLGDHKRYWISEYQTLEIKFPSEEEQAAIAAILSDMDADIAALEEKLNKARAVKQGMMQELLTGRVRLV